VELLGNRYTRTQLQYFLAIIIFEQIYLIFSTHTTSYSEMYARAGWYSVAGAQVFKFSYVPTQNAESMQVALQKHGPLAVAIAVANSFSSYR
jgi:hypothetical protein